MLQLYMRTLKHLMVLSDEGKIKNIRMNIILLRNSKGFLSLHFFPHINSIFVSFSQPGETAKCENIKQQTTPAYMKKKFVEQIIFHKHSNIFVIYYFEMKNGLGRKKKEEQTTFAFVCTSTFLHGCRVLRLVVVFAFSSSKCIFYRWHCAKMVFTQ